MTAGRSVAGSGNAFDPSVYLGAVAQRDPSSGIWATGAGEPVHYPADNHDRCFEHEDRSFWYQHRNRAIVATVERFPTTGVFFDVGGGNGVVSAELQKMGREVCLINPELAGLHNARARGIAHLVHGTLESCDPVAGTAPAAGLFDVLEHIADDRFFLGLLRLWLEPGGRLYLTVPSGPRLWSSFDQRVGHQRRYSRRLLATRLEEAGFEVDYLSHLFAPLPPLLWLTRVALPALGINDGSDRPALARVHHVRTTVTRRLLDLLLSLERAWLLTGHSLPLGSTLVAVARRSV